MRVSGAFVLVAVVAVAVLALPSSSTASHAPAVATAGAVFTLSNQVSGNTVIAYDRSSSGGLSWAGNFSTGGNGTGAALGDQGSLAVTADHHWLLAVDAGSNQITVFGIHLGGGPLLTRSSVTASGGVLPVSLAVSGPVVYVLNDGSTISQGNIAGFRLTASGSLNPIAGSTQPLSTSNLTAAAQVSFSPSGDWLVVTEKATNVIDVFEVNGHGVASERVSSTSLGTTPYGFGFDLKGHLIVSEAVSGSLSSYAVRGSGHLRGLSSSVTDLQGAPCWVVLSHGGRYAYTTNTHSDSISSYAVGSNGRIALLQSVGATTGLGPTDLALTGHLLYVYDSAAHDIEGFHVHGNGTLTAVSSTGGLLSGTVGLLAI
ncbi:MAG: lactonase family protein [Thermoplasmata archaeon]|nr:lactonase family protein [Thermoplasmata archaeon]